MNVRIQRQRTKGWRMPEGAIYVGRPSRWGNPFRIGAPDRFSNVSSVEESVRLFRALITAVPDRFDVAPLRGHDLVCWCPLDQPCHADVLLELAR